jgi:hypothetical protein
MTVWLHDAELGEASVPHELIISGAKDVLFDFDLNGKSDACDVLFEAKCSATSSWLDALKGSGKIEVARNRPQEFAGYFHFRFVLLMPVGELNVLGKDFSLSRKRS